MPTARTIAMPAYRMITVETTNGTLTGAHADGVRVFKGIPYAAGADRQGGACGSRNEPRLGAAADGGGTTGPMSPSGAWSRSTITGA
jgi:hypothetical protein